MIEQMSTFYLNGKRYGLPASDVQEIVPRVEITEVPLAPEHILGLINLRGQFATVVSLSKLFGIPDSDGSMNVVCRSGDSVLAFSVDEVGDVIEVDQSMLIATPGTIPRAVASFLTSIYRSENSIYGIVSIKKVTDFLIANSHLPAYSNSHSLGHLARKVQ